MLWAPLEARPEWRSLYPWLVVAKALALSGVLAWVGRHVLAGDIKPSWPRFFLGVLGCGLWFGIARSVAWGRIAGDRVAFDPFAEVGGAWARSAFLAARGLTAVVLVPIVEEVFWRSFLPRYLDRREFESLPPGRASMLGFSVSCALYAATHPEWLAAFAYGVLMCVWLRRTGSVWDCIQAHALTNLLLLAYILTSGEWWLW
jgi:CAAX protease family protein